MPSDELNRTEQLHLKEYIVRLEDENRKLRGDKDSLSINYKIVSDALLKTNKENTEQGKILQEQSDFNNHTMNNLYAQIKDLQQEVETYGKANIDKLNIIKDLQSQNAELKKENTRLRERINLDDQQYAEEINKLRLSLAQAEKDADHLKEYIVRLEDENRRLKERQKR